MKMVMVMVMMVVMMVVVIAEMQAAGTFAPR
jgi:hypothetical protein